LSLKTGMHTRQSQTFEKEINDELLNWVVRNEHLRRYTGQPYRIFTYRDPNKIEVNLNCLRHEYLDKFVQTDHEAYFQELLKRIEPVLFKVMAIYEIKEITIHFEFYFLARTYTKDITYTFATKTD
jgi:hypothetical protein